MLTASGVKLMDFGLAKTSHPPVVTDTTRLAHSVLTVEGTILGTLPYMAPEQLVGAEADARTDIFALGCVFYEMLTGTARFKPIRRPVSLPPSFPPTRTLPPWFVVSREPCRPCSIMSSSSVWPRTRRSAGRPRAI
jgi:serine/threonine protein kinase